MAQESHKIEMLQIAGSPRRVSFRKAFRRWAHYNDTPVRRGRTVRMADMLQLLQLPSGARVLDLGGTPYVWGLVEHDLRITLLNRPARIERTRIDRTRFEVISGDATDLKAVFANQSFDAVFSNSVIEHVGNEAKQRAFAEEVRRIGRAYWVQTPSDRALIEPHSLYPLQWQTMRLMRQDLVWRDTRVLTRDWMQELFPDGECYVERRFGLEKSYALYRPFGT